MENNEQPIKKKRGRKPKNVQPTNNEEPPVPKKRGRKPKGGKLITKINDNNENPVEISNVILHLKWALISGSGPNPFSTKGTFWDPTKPELEQHKTRCAFCKNKTLCKKNE